MVYQGFTALLLGAFFVGSFMYYAYSQSGTQNQNYHSQNSANHSYPKTEEYPKSNSWNEPPKRPLQQSKKKTKLSIGVQTSPVIDTDCPVCIEERVYESELESKWY